ncbi:hypothetical protein JL722_2584 [Aureococcus anophagefferens]|nr:hypothetical protein JL722_2584 [Aureococcus anophagefferens]
MIKKSKHGARAAFRLEAEARGARAARAAPYKMPVRDKAMVAAIFVLGVIAVVASSAAGFLQTQYHATDPSAHNAVVEFAPGSSFYLAVTATENATENTSTLLVYDGAAVVAGASSGTPFLFEFATACVLSFSPKARRSSSLALTAAVLGASCVRAEDEENQPPGSAEKKKKKRARIMSALGSDITVVDAEDLLAQLAAAPSSTTTTPAVEQPSTTTTPAVDSPLLQVMGNTRP